MRTQFSVVKQMKFIKKKKYPCLIRGQMRPGKAMKISFFPQLLLLTR